ncbi:hypothetical protein PspLS_08073 [Pyricularia sp. CBS 133598]|nr:hypothetical protein PspLS_08073 [Pyricularia sp. CBS 133598]
MTKEETQPMASDMASFSFLNFPPEIRHLIYEWMLCDFTTPRKADPSTFPDDMVRPPLKLGLENLSPAILRTSRQVHAEATAVMVRRCRFVHISATLDYWSIRSVVPRKLGVLCTERDLIQRFRGCLMTLHLGSTASPYSREHRIDCLILGRDLDAYCRSLGSWVDVPPDFGRRTSLTLVLGNPLDDPGKHAEYLLRALLQPFLKWVRGLERVEVRSRGPLALPKALAEEVETTLVRPRWEDFDPAQLLGQFRNQYLRSGFWSVVEQAKDIARDPQLWPRLAELGGPGFLGKFGDFLFEIFIGQTVSIAERRGDKEGVMSLLGSDLFTFKALRVLQDIGTIPNIIRASWEPNSAQLAELYFRKANVCHFRSIWQEDPETSFDCMRQALVAITEATKYEPRCELIPRLQELKKAIRDDTLEAVGDRLNYRGASQAWLTVCVRVIQPPGHSDWHPSTDSSVRGCEHPHGSRSWVWVTQLGTGQRMMGQSAGWVLSVMVGQGVMTGGSCVMLMVTMGLDDVVEVDLEVLAVVGCQRRVVVVVVVVRRVDVLLVLVGWHGWFRGQSAWQGATSVAVGTDDGQPQGFCTVVTSEQSALQRRVVQVLASSVRVTVGQTLWARAEAAARRSVRLNWRCMLMVEERKPKWDGSLFGCGSRKNTKEIKESGTDRIGLV